MDVQELLSQVRDTMTVRRVFGEPYEKDGVTVIPVARVAGGGGGGTGEGEQGKGSGGGFGVGATPAGV
ncbi:MAG: sporulation protein, partial [Thermomicrobiaceae bacterium]|nr:sporulation protein [Thermomicrobiaceae bacterium]